MKRAFGVAARRNVCIYLCLYCDSNDLIETATRPQPVEFVVWHFVLYAKGAVSYVVVLCDPSPSQTTISKRTSAHAPSWRAQVPGRRCKAHSSRWILLDNLQKSLSGLWSIRWDIWFWLFLLGIAGCQFGGSRLLDWMVKLRYLTGPSSIYHKSDLVLHA